MPGDPLSKKFEEGFLLQQRIANEYEAARGPTWDARHEALLAGWRADVQRWIAEAESLLAPEISWLHRFRNARVSPVVRGNTNAQWAGMHNLMTAKLEALEAIAAAGRPAAPSIVIDRSNINTGPVENLQQNVNIGTNELEKVLGPILAAVTEALKTLPADRQRQAHDQVETLREEAARGHGKWRLGSIAAILQGLDSLVSLGTLAPAAWLALKVWLAAQGIQLP